MTPQLHQYLYEVKCSLVDASIQRVADSGDMIHRFSLNIGKVLQATGKQRITENLIADVEGFFQSACISAEYNEMARAFDLTLDLNRVRFEPNEAHFFSVAMNRYRAEYGG